MRQGPRALRVFPGFNYRSATRAQVLNRMRQYTPGGRLPVRRMFLGFGATDAEGRYLPTPDEIVNYPEPGKFYKFGTYKKDETYYGIAKRAYGADNIKQNLLMMNASTWNDHIDRKKKGWTSYGVVGLQSTPDYDSTNNPRAKVLTGNEYPVVWIPPLTGEEPEQVGYKDPVVTTPEPVLTTPTPVTPPPAAAVPGPPGAKGDPGPPGAKGDPGPPPSPAEIQSAVDTYLIANPPPAGPAGPPGPPGAAGTGGGEGKGLWFLPLAALFAALKG